MMITVNNRVGSLLKEWKIGRKRQWRSNAMYWIGSTKNTRRNIRRQLSGFWNPAGISLGNGAGSLRGSLPPSSVQDTA